MGGRVERQSTFTREYFGGLNQSARAAIGVGPSADTMGWPPALPLAPLLRAVHSMSSRSQVPHAAQPSARLDGVLVFAEWLAYRQADVRDPVCAAATRRLYTSIWTLWLRHLAATGLNWSAAEAVDVLRFLERLQARRAVAPDGRPRVVSEVSRARYWQLLHWVYRRAFERGLCPQIPTDALQQADRPRKLNDDPTLIDPVLWRALPQAFPDPEHCDIYGLRDLAILQLLYTHALSSEEIRGMRMVDLIWPEETAGPKHPETASQAPAGVLITGSRACQERTIRFSVSQAQAMQAWLRQRGRQAKYQRQEWVFLSDRGNPISIRILFHLVSRTLEMASRQTGIPQPLRCGPQVIRNTAIREKLELNWPLEKIAAYAGLKNRESVWRHARWQPGRGFA